MSYNYYYKEVMMDNEIYELKFDKQPKKYMSKMPRYFSRKIKIQMGEIAEGNTKNKNLLKMKGYENRYRVRIGDYRVTYKKKKEKLVIKVIEVINRGDAYKNK